MIQRRTILKNVFKYALPVLMLPVFWLGPLPINPAWAEKSTTILRIHGSNTIGPRLMTELARQYLKIRGASFVTQVEISPGTEIDVSGLFPQENLSRIIEIKAHGTSSGFKNLKAGKCDIVMASRRITPAEEANLANLGDMSGVACEHVLALDGVAIIVHPDNKRISSVDLSTLARIFSGEINNWSRLGGPDAPIHLHARDKNSGTHDIFKQMVLEKRRESKKVVRWETNEALSDAVGKDPYAIGYCSLPYVRSNRILKISDGGLPQTPTSFSIGSEDYPLTRRLHLYTPANPPKTDTINFVAFALGNGQEFIYLQDEFVPLKISAQERVVEMIGTVRKTNVINPYLTAVNGAKRLSTTYRFKRDNDELDSRSIHDLERMAEFFNDNPINEIILAGFADNQGLYSRNYRLSCRRMETVKQAFLERGITVQKSLCVGEEVPVASNQTMNGRHKNRRVEVWVK